MEAGVPPLWWVGCHGGAGVTTMAKLTGIGVEMGAAWPQVPPDWRLPPVVLVARASAAGMRAAEAVVEQCRRTAGTDVMGLVVVDASPKRPPRIVTERLQLIRGWLPAIWRVGWVETFLAADDPLDVGVPPDVQTVRHALDRLLTEVGAQ
ncbi:DUF6668 family protein [Actinoplanes subglobosus]|uniref:DUF6668 family protein n=1 Tax=Actinoplanes subglobosus TaxID=1547892 RepID=A0ABV8IV12_9ACTN